MKIKNGRGCRGRRRGRKVEIISKGEAIGSISQEEWDKRIKANS